MYFFSAHLGGTDQTGCVHDDYTDVICQHTDYNEGNYFSTVNSLWTPPAGHVIVSCNVWLSQNFIEPPTAPSTSCNVCAKVHKSTDGVTWTDLKACPGWTPAGFTNTAGAGHTFFDVAAGDEVYQLIIFTTSKDALNNVVIDGNPAHTWWQGIAYADA